MRIVIAESIAESSILLGVVGKWVISKRQLGRPVTQSQRWCIPAWAAGVNPSWWHCCLALQEPCLHSLGLDCTRPVCTGVSSRGLQAHEVRTSAQVSGFFPFLHSLINHSSIMCKYWVCLECQTSVKCSGGNTTGQGLCLLGRVQWLRLLWD